MSQAFVDPRLRTSVNWATRSRWSFPRSVLFQGAFPMPVTIVVGGQFGSEGKGKVTSLIANRSPEPWVVRCGGPNSGHTTAVLGREVILRQLPAAVGHTGARLLLSAGCVVDERVLAGEIERFGIEPGRVIVDPRAVLLAQETPRRSSAWLRLLEAQGRVTGGALPTLAAVGER